MSNVFLTGQLVCSDHEQATMVAQHLPLHIKLTRAEQGCLSFEVKPTQNPLIWQVDEQFQDAASFRAHQKRVAESEWGRATAGIARHYEIEGMEPV
ncbi:antibiotic biosynthesis monooxygenase [uncultured Arthrobacter sp.]|uniref:putative quinol monooxygenase n=1 Tax=uncultured Arthrobacter sp. TaxID=114050 RepID=UPI003216ECDA